MFDKRIPINGALAIAVLLAAALPPAAQAGEVHARVNHEQSRIRQGVSSGQLTRGEYAHVQTRLATINANRRQDLRSNGGRLTPAEKHNLNTRENKLSKSIYFDKHNVVRQPGTPH